MSRDTVRLATNMFVTHYGIKMRAKKARRYQLTVQWVATLALVAMAITAAWVVKR